MGQPRRVFSYNPATDTFTTLAAGDNWPGSQAGTFLPGGFAVAGNKLYIIGSFNANAVPPVMTNQVWQFDPTAAVGSKWLARANYPQARGYVPAASIGGLIYTGGGSALDPTGALIDSAESFKYDPCRRCLDADHKHTESDRRDARGCDEWQDVGPGWRQNCAQPI